MGWKRRLGIAMSVVWILFWIIAYLTDSPLDLRKMLVGLMGLGIFPVLISWLTWWVWDGYSRSKKPQPPNTK